MRFHRPVNGLILITSLLGILLSCRPAANDETALSHAKATREWHKHMRILEDSLEGPSDPEQFLESAVFFQELTGISVRGITTIFGLGPNQFTEQDLNSLKKWYAANERMLYWDDESRSVKLRNSNDHATGSGD